MVNSFQMPTNPAEKAFLEFREAWETDKRLDVEAFCKQHPGCSPELRERIDDFLFMMKGVEDLFSKGEESSSQQEGACDISEGLILGDFKINKLIGKGGMAKVYEAEQISLKRSHTKIDRDEPLKEHLVERLQRPGINFSGE